MCAWRRARSSAPAPSSCRASSSARRRACPPAPASPPTWPRARSSSPARSTGETSCVTPEARHGCAGARPSDGGCGGPYRGPPRRSMSRVLLVAEATARSVGEFRRRWVRTLHRRYLGRYREARGEAARLLAAAREVTAFAGRESLDPEGLRASAARRFYEDELLRNDPEALAFLTRELMAEWWPPRDEPGLTFDGVWLPDLMPVTKGILLRLDVVEYLGIVLRALDEVKPGGVVLLTGASIVELVATSENHAMRAPLRHAVEDGAAGGHLMDHLPRAEARGLVRELRPVSRRLLARLRYRQPGGPLAGIVAPYARDAVTWSLATARLYLAAAFRALDAHRPAAVVITSDRRMSERALALAARRRGIPSLLFYGGEKEAFYRTVHDAVSAVGGLEVVVKVHPNEDVALLRRQISEWGWPDARLTKEYDIHRLFGAADAAVMVTSMAGIEAMAMGCPVIAVQTPGKDFEGGGMPAYVSEGAVERVDMGDAKALATVLRRLVTDRSARAALVYRGRRFAAPYLHPVDGALADRLQGVVDELRRELTAGGAQAPGDGSREGRS